MCILEVLRCILCCGEEEERDRYNYSGLPANPPEAYQSRRALQPFIQSARSVSDPRDHFKSSLYTSRSGDPVINWWEKSLILEESGKKSPSASKAPSIPLPSKASPSFNTSSQSSPLSSKASPSLPPSQKLLRPLPSSKDSPSSPLSSKASAPPILPSNASPTPLPSSKASSSPALSKASPYVLPSSKASPTTTPSSKTSSPPILPSNPSPTPLASSKASSSPALSNTSPYVHPSSKASPTTPSSSKPSESDKRSPELPQIKHQVVLPRYEIPKDLQDLFEKGLMPVVLKRPLSPSNYADYFATLLYAEDFYLEKWSKFLLSGVTLELRSRVPFENPRQTKKTNKTVLMDKKDFVAFKIDSVPEKRPYLLSRDFVFVRPLDMIAEPFKGILFRVVKSTTVLVEFGDDFHSQHSSTKRYDVSFSFNRVCLKRFHQAVSAAMKDPLRNVLFPDPISMSSSLNSSLGNLNQGRVSVASRILNHKGPLPYFVEGPVSVTFEKLSTTGAIIQETVLKIYRTSAHCRILICSPMNQTCDALMKSLYKEIPRTKLFRANAAFRDYDLVPGDIIPECMYQENKECFTCPPLSELQNFQVITSTFVSSFRLHAAGITADHFTHIFLVDASSVTEPETAIALANLVGKNTVVVVTGSLGKYPGWVRTKHGLKRSYFQRLLEREPYMSRDPMFITHLKN